ncbi:MAG: hypothetical protein F6K30_05715 [Cyanothece sp. SIO2G6]|nr:hypothetical protein [Cyanothece sp. SIO2G6]
MGYRIIQLHRLHKAESRKTFTLGLILLCNSFALQNSFVTSVSGFLSNIGASQFLIISVVSYFLMLIIMSLQALIVDRFNRMTLIKGTAYSFALAFVLIRLIFLTQLPNWLKYSVFCLTTEIQWLIFPLVFWIFANSIFAPSDSKRIFPTIGAWSIAGSLIGIGISTFLPAILREIQVSSHELITVNIIVYAVILICLESKHLRPRDTFVGDDESPIEPTFQELNCREKGTAIIALREMFSGGWHQVQKVPALRYLMYSIFAVSFCDAIIEFHFLSTSISTYGKTGEYHFVYGLYRLTLAVLGFTIQAFLSSKLIQKLGLKNTFLIMPLGILLSLLGMIAIPGFASGLGGILVFRLCWDTIDESTRKSFHGFVPNKHRGRISLFLDGNLFCLGNIAGFVVTGLIILLGGSTMESSFYIYLSLAAIASFISLWAIMRMRAAYDRTILNWQLQQSGY